MNIDEKITNIWTDYVKPTVIIGGIVIAAGLIGKLIYDRTLRDDPETYKGFPKNFEPKNVTIFRPDGDMVRSDIVFVEMLPNEAYKKFNVNDSVIAYEGDFKYSIRAQSSGLFPTDYGSAIRHGRVEGVKK